MKTLLETLPDTNFLTDDKEQILSFFTLDAEGNVVLSRSLIVPPNSVFVSENLGIEGAGEAFGVFDRSNNRRGYLIAYLRGVNSKPFYRKLISFTPNVSIQPLKDTNSDSDTFTQDITFTANRNITKVYIESPNDTTGANLYLRRGGHVIAQSLNTSFTANTVKEIEIPQGIFCTNGGQVTLDVQGVTLKGTGAAPNFEVFLEIDNYIYEDTELQDSLGTPTSDNQIAVFDSDGSVSFQDIPSPGGTPRTDAEIQAIVGAMFTNNSETGITSTYDSADQKIDLAVSSAPTPTTQYKVFTQTGTTVTQAIIEAVTDESDSLPYRYILPTPVNNNMIVAWHSSTAVQDIHVNILEASETEADITTSPLGNRFVQSAVQTVGDFSYIIVNIAGDLGLLTTGEKLGIYVG